MEGEDRLLRLLSSSEVAAGRPFHLEGPGDLVEDALQRAVQEVQEAVHALWNWDLAREGRAEGLGGWEGSLHHQEVPEDQVAGLCQEKPLAAKTEVLWEQ